MTSHTIREIRQFISTRRNSIIVVVIIGFFVAWVFGALSLKVFQDAFHAYVHNKDAEVPHSLQVYSEGIAALFGLVFILSLETFDFLIYLKERILIEIKGEETESTSTLARLLFRFDPVDASTVNILINDLQHLIDYFGSITYIKADRWFAGDKYLALLFCQVQELIKRKASEFENLRRDYNGIISWNTVTINTEMFRIIVWPESWFFKSQSIAVLRTLYFFYAKSLLPLRTYIITESNFNRIMKNPKLPVADVDYFKSRGEFWICNRQSDSANPIWTLTWGQKQYFLRWIQLPRAEVPHVERSQYETTVSKRLLEYLKGQHGSIALDEVFDMDVLYDDEALKTRLRNHLEKLAHPAFPDYPVNQ